MKMAIKKIKSGEAIFISEQTFETVEDAMSETNPKQDPEIVIQEVKINSTKIKNVIEEEVKKNVLGQ